MTFLEQVAKEKKRIVKDLKSKTPLRDLKKMLYGIEKRAFSTIFSQRYSGKAKIIAEIKKASPSRGILVSDLILSKYIKDYEHGGASAISVITEEKFFHGSISYLLEAKKTTALPILHKDFIIDEYEIYQSKTAGADAVLLISELLEKSQIEDYLKIAAEIDIDILLEVHSMSEFEKTAGLDGFVLGINNRDLKTLKVDLSTSHRILCNIPNNYPVIIESGIETRYHIKEFMDKGVSGFLIGSSLILSSSPRAKLEELLGKK